MMEEDNRLDQLFKKRLSDTDNAFAYNEEDWNKLDLLLNQKEKRQRFLTWMRVGTTIAALALLFTSFWIFKVAVPLRNDSQKFSNEKKTIKNSAPKAEQLMSFRGDGSDLRVRNKPLRKVHNVDFSSKKTDHDLASELSPQQNSSSVLALNIKTAIDSNTQSTDPVTTALLPNGENVSLDSIQSVNQFLEPSPLKKNTHLLAISLIASSDINGVNSLKKGRVGRNYGMLISMGLTKRLTIQTGINYALKSYDVEYTYTNAYAYKVKPLSASANCDMLDIPLDIDYAILDQSKYKINIGTGLSSYIMLNENYRYNYAPTAKPNTTTYDIASSKSYFWSMLNLTATYQRKLSSNLGILVQPYLKVPLKEVGYSDIKLHSAGVSVGLQMNFSRKK